MKNSLFVALMLSTLLASINARSEGLEDRNIKMVYFGVNEVNKELAEREANEKLSCEQIAVKAKKAMSNTILDQIAPVISTRHEVMRVKGVCETPTKGLCTREQLESGSCHDFVLKHSCMKDVTKFFKVVNYSEDCSDENKDYANMLKSAKAGYSGAEMSSDDDSSVLRSKYRGQVKTALENKIYINISSAKLSECHAEINQALRDNGRKACYRNLIQRDWSASIFESETKLRRLSASLKTYSNRLDSRPLASK